MGSLLLLLQPRGPLVADAFTGADGAAWDGAKWTLGVNPTSSGGTTIQVNEGRLATGNLGGYAGGDRISRRFNTGDRADAEILTTFHYDATECYPQLVLRGNTALDTGGGYHLSPNRAAGTLSLHRVVNFASTQLGSKAAVYTAGTLYRARFRVAGSTVQGRVWPAANVEPIDWDFNVVDTGITAAGAAGITVGGGNAAASSFVYLDDAQLSDGSAPAAVAHLRSLVSPMGLTSLRVAALSAGRQAVDISALTDLRTALLASRRAQADASTSTDAATAVRSAAATRADGSALTDGASWFSTTARAATDASPLGETAMRRYDAPRTAIDPTALADSGRAALTAPRARPEQLALADTATAAGVLRHIGVESLVSTDVQARSHGALRMAVDADLLADVRTVMLEASRSRTEAAGLQETVERTATGTQARIAVDLAGLGDTAARVLRGDRSAIDVSLLSDVVMAWAQLLRVRDENVRSTDATATRSTLRRLADDRLTITDAAAPNLAARLAVVAIDALRITDAATPQLLLSASIPVFVIARFSGGLVVVERRTELLTVSRDTPPVLVVGG